MAESNSKQTIWPGLIILALIAALLILGIWMADGKLPGLN